MARRDLKREAVVSWIKGIEHRFRVTIPEIARRARVSASTIYRWSDQGHPFNASLTSIEKIAAAFGVPLPGSEEHAGLAEEGDAYKVAEDTPLEADGGDQSVWKLASRVLELAGYLPGDLLLVDMAEQPRSGDAVVAQVYNLERGDAETKIRIFEAPFLMTRTMDPGSSDRPLYVDNERVAIVGTITRSLRLRAA